MTTDSVIHIRGAAIATRDENHRMLKGADILIRNDRIVAVGEVPAELAATATKVIDARNRIAFPGFVNAHTHSPLANAKGIYDLANHRSGMWMFQAVTSGRTRDEVYASALLNCIEMLLTGTTACVDHFPEQGFSIEDVDAVVQAYKDCGIRAVVALRVFDERYRDIYPPAGEFPQDLTDALATRDTLKPRPASELLALCEEAVDRYHDKGGRIQIAPAPSNPMRCTDALLVGCQELADRRDTQVHCHLLETQIQTVIAKERFGTTMVKHLDAIGALSDRLSCAHTVWIGDDDIALMAERGAMVVHNPASNIRGGSGIAPIAKMIRAGVTVALGCDGNPSGGSQALQPAMNLATIIGRPHAGKFSDWVSTENAMDMATIGGAKVMGLDDDIAMIAPGRKADIVLYDSTAPWWRPLNNATNQMVHSESGTSARDVFIDGRHVVADGRITTFDADAVLEEAQGHFDRVVGRNHELMDLAKRLGEAAQ